MAIIILNRLKERFKMKKLQNYLLLLLLLALVQSCDPGYSDNYYINNKSDYEVTVKYLNWDEDTLINIPTNTEKRFYSHSDIGNAYDMEDEFLIFFDSLDIYINDSIGISKDYTKRSNWKFDLDEGCCLDGGTAEYTFVVKNEDVEVR